MKRIPANIKEVLQKHGIEKLRPAQDKALNSGLLDGENLLVCTPTASGKTLIAEIAFLNHILNNIGNVIYIVPLKALASEKYKEFKQKYPFIRIALSTGDLDSSDNYLANYELIIATSEKVDSLIRHKSSWLRQISLLIIDEIHLLNDVSRGPTLEIIITIMRKLNRNLQLLGLSATIGNPRELADWLDANLVEDSWRPVPLKMGVYVSEIKFIEEIK